MYVSFQTLSASSRVWVYQSKRALTISEQSVISEVLKSFTENWLVHGQPMHSSFEIRDNHFIIIAADEEVNAASGCSIDDSVRVVRKLGEELSLDFFDRNQVALVKGGEVEMHPLSEVKRALDNRTLSETSDVVNTLIQSKAELASKWIIPLGTSWLKRFLPQPSVSS